MKKATKLNVSRRELKYFISEGDKHYIHDAFNKCLYPDAYNKDTGYPVRSLYFDSIDNMDFYSKIDGEHTRKKIRLRVYSPFDTKAKLEVKYKMGIDQHKASLIIEKEDAQRMIRGDYSCLLEYEDDLAFKVYTMMVSGAYRPAVIVEYDRIAFSHPNYNIRTTLDLNLRKNEWNFDLFDDQILFMPVFDQPYSILEVKYDTYLFNWIKDLISYCECTQQSISKYCLSRSQFHSFLS